MYFYILLLTLGDEARAFVEELYEKYASYMYAIAYDILKNPQDAEDAVSEAMCKIIKYMSKFEGSTDKNICSMITIGIKKIAKNKAIDLYNKRKLKASRSAEYYREDDETGEFSEMDFEDPNVDVENTVIMNEEISIIRKALLELSEEMQDAVELVYLHGYSCVEAADYLDTSASAVRVRLFNARNRLRTALEGKVEVR